MQIQKLSFKGYLLVGEKKYNTSDIKRIQMQYERETAIITNDDKKHVWSYGRRDDAQRDYDRLLAAYTAASANPNVTIKAVGRYY